MTDAVTDLELVPLRPEDAPAFQALIGHPSLRPELDGWDEARDVLADPFSPPNLRWLARAGGEPVGFALTFVLPSDSRPWALVLLGVVDGWRRRGIGSRLLSATLGGLRRSPDIVQLELPAWLPNDAAEAFAARHGFAHERFTWLMERPRGAAPAAEWPAGIEFRTFDGTDRAFEDWNDVSVRGFAGQKRAVRSTVEDCRKIAAGDGFHPDGLVLAYREGRCVGFCRNHLREHRGEIAFLAVAPEARQIGLGRALLRWGMAWLESRGAERVTLLVMGDNEGAIALYRSEGFATARTRRVWALAMDG